MSAPKTEKVNTDPDNVTPVEAEKVSDINLNNVGRFKKTTDEMEVDADQAETILAGNPQAAEVVGSLFQKMGINWYDGIDTAGDFASVGLAVLVLFTGTKLIFPMKVSG